MNEGENSGMSNGPIFSSPNIAGSQPEPEKGPVPMPEQPVDVTKTDNPIVTTTLASMPGDEQTKPTITSGGDAIDKKKPRFGLGTRRFKEKNQASDAPIMQAAQPTAFANAPEFFNDAVGDIVLADAADAEKKNKTKKFIIIGVAVAVAVVALLIGATMLINRGKNVVASDFKKAFYSLANTYFYNEEKEDGLKEEISDTKIPYAWSSNPNSEYAEKLKTKYDAFLESYKKNKKQIKIDDISIEFEERFAVLIAKHHYKKLSDERHIELATSQTLAQVNAIIEAYYVAENVPSLVTAILDNYKEESLIKATFYDTYSRYGCAKKGKVTAEGDNGKKEKTGYYIDNTCVLGKLSADERKAISSSETEIEKIRQRSSAIFGDTEKILGKTILSIKNSIEGKK